MKKIHKMNGAELGEEYLRHIKKVYGKLKDDVCRVRVRGDLLKHDKDKPMWDLLPLKSVEKIVDVLTYGAGKYFKHTWREVEDGKNRYFAAMMRHLSAHQCGEVLDPESGLSHLAHAACNIIFLLAFEVENK